MAQPANVDEMLELIRKSGISDERKFDAYLQRLRAAGAMPGTTELLAQYLIRDGFLTHFQAEQILQGKWKRFSIGKYKVLERLGSGGMGSVFLCEHKLMRRRVAVKVLPTAKAQDQAALERFYREARAVAALDHPNIVHAYDIDQDDKLHFLVMEYVDGASLQEIIKRSGPLDVTRACHYMHQSAIGLHHAHERGLLHRDIKPGNILVDRTGLVKILDMGLARFFNDEEDILTRKYDENVLGTADYLSPEQARDSHVVDIRADIYSLGGTFYFVLTGKSPVGEGSVAQKLMWHQNKNPKPIPEIDPRVPWDVWRIIEKMMAKDPDKRHQTPLELAAALEPYTRTPIGPPPEKEMPKLSLAATGAAPLVGDPETMITSGTAAAPGPATPAPGSKNRGLSQPASPAPGSGKRSALPRTPAPTRPAAVAVVPQPQTAPEFGAWESLTDTRDPAKAITEPVNPAVAVPHFPPPVAENPKRVRATFLGVALFALGVLGFFGAREFLFKPSPNNPTPKSTERPKLEIGKSVQGASAYPTIQAALRYAKPGDVLELHDEVHKENLTIDSGGKIATDVTLQAAPGKNVTWTALKNDETTPLLRLMNAKSFRILGRGITLDGTLDPKRRVQNLIVVSGRAPGLSIDDLTLEGFSRSGLNLLNLSGTQEQPVRFHGLTIRGTKGDKLLNGGIFLDVVTGLQPDIIDHVEIGDDVQFLNLDAGKNIRVRDPSFVTPQVTWPGRK